MDRSHAGQQAVSIDRASISTSIDEMRKHLAEATERLTTILARIQGSRPEATGPYDQKVAGPEPLTVRLGECSDRLRRLHELLADLDTLV